VRRRIIMAKTFTQAQVQEIVNQAVAQALASMQKPTSTGKGKAKTATFTKHDGTTVACTPAQKQVWEKHRDSYADRMANREQALAKHAQAMSTYKPSKALKDAIKADRASITFAVAKAQYGFVGTKQTLKALKDSICK
jgi:hypothetical protein